MLISIGNHTFAAVKGAENFYLKKCFAPVWQELARIILNPTIIVGERVLELNFVFGADYKVKHTCTHTVCIMSLLSSPDFVL